MSEGWTIFASAIVTAIPLIGTAVAVLRAVHEMRLGREQRCEELHERQQELRWKQAQLAKQVLDEAWADRGARDALVMLDWSGRSFDDHGRRTPPLTHPAVAHALRVAKTPFTPGEQFIRDCFDRLLEAITRTEHFVRIGLIHFDDVRDRWTYYVALAGRMPMLREFVAAYNYPLAVAYFERFGVDGFGPIGSERRT